LKPANWSGIRVSSLAAASVSLLEKVIQWHPNWHEGVLVEQVLNLIGYAIVIVVGLGLLFPFCRL